VDEGAGWNNAPSSPERGGALPLKGGYQREIKHILRNGLDEDPFHISFRTMPL
jgi:hypothetical protein